jgi:hypothetical protein
MAVIGRNRTQSSSVVSTFLSEPGWRVRGISRNTTSDASQALISRGVKMVATGLNNTQKLIHTFEGANAIFAATDFFSSFIDPAAKAKLRPG